MLQGLTTISFYADDLRAAQDWYTEFLGIEPYYRTPAYIEFRVGQQEDELGIIDSRYAPPGARAAVAGAVVYWHVGDVPETLATLTSLGATVYQEPQDRGEGFVTAAVVDPFGNIMGVMYNPHHVKMSGRSRQE